MSDDWTDVTLGDLCRHVVDRHAASRHEHERYVGLEHMPTGSPRVETLATTAGLASQVVGFEPDDILFGRLRPYLRKVAWAHFAGACSPEILVLRPRTSLVLPAYLYLLASSEPVIDWAVSTSAGSRMPRTAPGDLLAFRVRLPPRAEQERICDLVGTIDEVASRAQAEERAADALLRSLRSELIEGSGAPRRRLSNVLTDIDGGVSPITEGRAPAPGEPAVLKLSAVRPGRFWPNEAKALTAGTAMPDRARVHVGDVLITRSNTPDTVGFVCLVDQVRPNTYLSDLILRLHPGPDVLPAYLAHALLTDASRSQIVGSARGTSGSMRKISRATIGGIQIPVPISLDEQQAVVATLAAAADVRDRAHEAGQHVATLRASLLEELLSGAAHIPASYDRLLGRAA